MAEKAKWPISERAAGMRDTGLDGKASVQAHSERGKPAPKLRDGIKRLTDKI